MSLTWVDMQALHYITQFDLLINQLQLTGTKPEKES